MFENLPTIPVNLIYFTIPLGMVIVIVILGVYLGSLRLSAPEAFLFKKARRKDLEVLCVTDVGSGFSEYRLGEKENQRDIIFEGKDNSDIKVDPGILQRTDSMKFGKGLVIHYYASKDFAPQTYINALGFSTIRRVVRDTFPELSWATDELVGELIATKRDNLLEDLKVLITQYAPKYRDEQGNEIPFTADSLASVIEELQEILKTYPVDTGLYSFTAAYVMNPTAYLANHVDTMRNILEQLADLKWQKMMDMMKWVIPILAILGGTTICAVILFLVIGK
jgi:hypothetical protein